MTPEQKELAAKALAKADGRCSCPDCCVEFGEGFLRDLDNLQSELAKVGLAIQLSKVNEELVAHFPVLELPSTRSLRTVSRSFGVQFIFESPSGSVDFTLPNNRVELMIDYLKTHICSNQKIAKLSQKLKKHK